jgi:hypothetical protein
MQIYSGHKYKQFKGCIGRNFTRAASADSTVVLGKRYPAVLFGRFANAIQNFLAL